jgi:large subunit ribosomal protein L25
MEEIILDVQPREAIGKAKAKDLRRKGFIPGILYAQGKDSKAIQVSNSDLLKLIHQHRLESVVVNLRVLSQEAKAVKKDKGRPCLIKEIQYDPVKGDIIHVDFNEISLSKTVKVNVPVVAKGEPIGVKQEGGSLEHILWELEVECLPTDIPQEIAVDVSQLKIGDDIHIKDITFPAKIKVLNNTEAIVLSVVAPLKEEVIAPAPVEGEEKLEPEVIKEKKEVPAEEEAQEKVQDKEKSKDKAKDK